MRDPSMKLKDFKCPCGATVRRLINEEDLPWPGPKCPECGKRITLKRQDVRLTLKEAA